MYNKFSPYKMEQAKEMIEPHEVILKTLSRKKTGLEFHNKLYLIFKLLNMKGFAEEQKYHLMSEMESFIHLQKYYMKKYHKVPDVDGEKIQFDPYNLSQMDIDNLTGDKKSVIIKMIFDEWKKWECDTVNILTEYLENSSDNCDEIEKIINEVEHEIHKLKKQMIEYNDVGWCIKHIYNKQYYIKSNYEDKIKEIFD